MIQVILVLLKQQQMSQQRNRLLLKGKISREIRPLAALYPPPPIHRAVISSFALNLRYKWSPGEVCSSLRHLRPFLLYQSKNAASGLISREIAKMYIHRLLQNYEQ